MGVGGADNPLWLDVLEWGPDSDYAGWFDIDWDPDRRYLLDKLLVPFLGDQYGVELEAGKLEAEIRRSEGSFAVWAYDTHKLPICPLHYERVLGARASGAGADRRLRSPACRSGGRRSAARAARRSRPSSPRWCATARQCARHLEPRHRLNGSWQRRLAGARRADPGAALARRLFPRRGRRHQLPPLLQHQRSRRPAHGAAGRVSTMRIACVIPLLEDGTLDGLRIDHIDGLLDPKRYLRRLRAAAPRPFYLVSRRSSPRTSSCARTGRSRARPATSSPTWSSALLIDPAGEESFTRDLSRALPASPRRSRRSSANARSASWRTRWRAS